ncbi:MAG: phage tail protein [Aggregatilineales bacterium]
MPRTGAPIEIHPSFRFAVKIDNINYAAFTECTLPNLQVETQDIKEGGQNEYVHKLPVRVNVGTITLRHGITKDFELLNWYIQVLQGEIEKATRTVEVVMYGTDLKPLSTWMFERAYPVKWSGPTLKTADQALAIEVLELAHHGFVIK